MQDQELPLNRKRFPFSPHRDYMGGVALRPLGDRRRVDHSPRIQLKDVQDRQTNMLNIFINSGLYLQSIETIAWPWLKLWGWGRK